MRAVVLVIDSFGIGALPDAGVYGDTGANTAYHICQVVTHGGGRVNWPNLQEMGLGNCSSLLGGDLPGCDAVREPTARFGVMAAKSPGKDTTTGHWELSGLVLDAPFTVFSLEYPSFPEQLTQEFTELTGHEVLGNKGGSGTAILDELGEAHCNGKGLIVYTSADSVMQIAAHEEVLSAEKLYEVCRVARKLCDPYGVGRVIARPFVGTPGNFVRTGNRRDFSILPPQGMLFDTLQGSGVETVAVGKIGDIFAEQGIDTSYHDSGNPACLDRLRDCLGEKIDGDQFIFVNLVDTDMLYGHRRDVQGYHDAVAAIDLRLPEITGLLEPDDMLIITADHGCDPTFKGTDHTREYVPLLVFKKQDGGGNLGVRDSFADVGQSLVAYFKAKTLKNGKSFVAQ